MLIKFLEVANFRKLLSVRIELSESTTLFVGANNSGKTSAMSALRKFLSQKSKSFEIYDFTLCYWSDIDAIGEQWIASRKKEEVVELLMEDWAKFLPSLDIWIEVGRSELHYVRDLIPRFGWKGGYLGVRLRLEPKNLVDLHKEFLDAYFSAEAVRDAARRAEEKQTEDKKKREEKKKRSLTVWPTNLVDFLEQRLSSHFEIRSYVLDPEKIEPPNNSQAQIQELSAQATPIGRDPLAGLIRVDEISAQRGLGESSLLKADDADPDRAGSLLSEQLRSYYAKHLDPTKQPLPEDLEALLALELAQEAFDDRLKESFEAAFVEVEGMGYPGVTDPRPRVTTKLKPLDGLNHKAAVTFEVDVVSENGIETPVLRLPENNNGLGYQNLISMIFRLLSFRDAWMRVGKASESNVDLRIEPLHLVLVEEPEAHLHAQVQQVFIKQAYKTLRSHKSLGDDVLLRTQLVVSTHSSHVAHEIAFGQLRYFRRLPAGMAERIPVSSVVNLSKTFGLETKNFVTRYLRAHHADLFFADAAILVEGPAEKMLLPNFIKAKHQFLDQCYLTILEIGGSHAHRLQPLIEELGLLTLIVTDLDSIDNQRKATQPSIASDQSTNNPTLKGWLPKLMKVDDLLSASAVQKVDKRDALYQVRVAYQCPVTVRLPGTHAMNETACPYTFEDALAFQNLEFFQKLEGTATTKKFRDAISQSWTAVGLGQRLFDALKSNAKKTELALDVINEEAFDKLIIPNYIEEALTWLEDQLRKKKKDVLDPLVEL